MSTLIIMGSTTAVLLMSMGVLLWCIPNYTRPNLFFSVTVEPDFRLTPQARAILARYQRNVVLHTAIAFALLIGIMCFGWKQFQNALSIAVLIVPLFWQTGGIIAVVVQARAAAWPHRIQSRRIREASLQKLKPNRNLRRLTVILLLAPLVLIIIGACYLGLRWEDIPDRYPSHWNAAGEVDGWMTKSLSGVFGALLFALTGYLSAGVIFGLMALTRRTASSGIAAKKETRFRQLVKVSVLLLANLLAVFMVLFAVWLPFRNSRSLPMGLIVGTIAVELAWVIGFFILLVRAGQGGHRLKTKLTNAETINDESPGDGTPDNAWRGGLFYFNPDDPAIMVEKRFGIGWDLNWGNKWSWIILSALLLPSMFIMSVSLWKANGKYPTTAISQVQETFEAAGITFENDPRLIDNWQAVAFVVEPSAFDPTHPTPADQLFLKKLDIQPGGIVADSSWIWSRGIFYNQGDHTTAKYELRQINSRDYLFMEWISGDVTLCGMKPNYYVLQRTDAVNSRK